MKKFLSAINVDGLIESIFGGFKFPDGSTQAIAGLTKNTIRNIPTDFLECLFNGAAQQGSWNAVAISSGTFNVAPSSTIFDTYPVLGVFLLRSSASANSGVSIRTGASEILIKGGEEANFILAPRLTSTLGTTRFGFLDTGTSASPTDGLCFEITGNGVLNGVNYSNGSNNSVSITTLSDNVFYHFKITVNAAANSVNYSVYNLLTGALIASVDNTSSTPTGSSRLLGHGIVATNSGSSANDICLLDYMDYHLKNRQRGLLN